MLSLRQTAIDIASTLFLGLLVFPLGTTAQPGEPWEKPLVRCWIIKSGSEFGLSIASDNDFHFFSVKTPSIINRYSAIDGRLSWTAEVAGQLYAGPFLAGEKVYSVSQIDGGAVGDYFQIYEHDPETGLTRLVSSFPNNEASAKGNSEAGFAASLPGKGAILVARGSGIVELEGAQWEHGSFSFRDSTLFHWIGREVNSFRPGEPQHEVFSFSSDRKLSGAFEIGRGRLYAGTEDGNVMSIEMKDKKIRWRSRTGGSIEDLEITDRGIMVISRDNFVYLLASDNGRRFWKRKLAGRILGKAVLDENHAAFLTYGSNEIYILRLSDGKLVNTFAVESAEYFVGPPHTVGAKLLIPSNAGISAFAPGDGCAKK